MKKSIQTTLSQVTDRLEFWVDFINKNKVKTIAELGVYRGNFAEEILKKCPGIEKYIMIDPWRHLDEWNKPSNKADDIFEGYFQETMGKTNFAKDKIQVLRGTTLEVIDQMEDLSLDMVYIDGDHTLKGIAIDLVNLWDKVKSDGYVCGDDFTPTIWQHNVKFEPTVVFPFAIYFAEAKKSTIYALPYKQFVIDKNSKEYKLFDLTEGKYKNTSLLRQFRLYQKKKNQNRNNNNNQNRANNQKVEPKKVSLMAKLKNKLSK